MGCRPRERTSGERRLRRLARRARGRHRAVAERVGAGGPPARTDLSLRASAQGGTSSRARGVKPWTAIARRSGRSRARCPDLWPRRPGRHDRPLAVPLSTSRCERLAIICASEILAGGNTAPFQRPRTPPSAPVRAACAVEVSPSAITKVTACTLYFFDSRAALGPVRARVRTRSGPDCSSRARASGRARVGSRGAAVLEPAFSSRARGRSATSASGRCHQACTPTSPSRPGDARTAAAIASRRAGASAPRRSRAS